MSSLPTTLGKYQIIREIARSNDIVYEAYDPLMNRRVALKELAILTGATPQQREDRVNRFMREARAVGTLAHPNIMTVFEYGQDSDRHFMAMEFLDGHTLRNEIDTKGVLDHERALDIALSILRGLEHAHSKGVIHRDIKPDNIQLLSSGEIKITDFGIARLTFQPNLTMDGQVFGTPSYMSPEQVVGKDIDARSDLFSVGVLLYEMMSGAKPFAGDSVVSITYAIMNREPDRLQNVNHTIQQVVEKALDKSPALRYLSAADMISAVEQAKKSLKGDSLVLDPPTSLAQNPYMAAPPMIQAPGTPYNPYSSAPQMPAPPVLYPYNPYQNPGAGGVAPHTGGMQPLPQGFQQVPIYYPPPPRQPLLKPETKHFIGKLFLTLLVMGTLVAVVLIAVIAVGDVWSRNQTRQEDAITIKKLQEIPDTAAVVDKISQAETLVARLKNPVNKAEQSKRLAVYWEQAGKQAMAQQQWSNAENAFNRSIELDPGNHKLVSNMAALYSSRAKAQRDLEGREALYQQAAKYWNDAAEAAGNDEQYRILYYEAEGKEYYDLAYEFANAGRYQQAQNYLTEADGYVREGRPLKRNIADLLEWLRGRS